MMRREQESEDQILTPSIEEVHNGVADLLAGDVNFRLCPP